MALFANDEYVVCCYDSETQQYLPVTQQHNIYTNAKNENEQMSGTVLYEAKDIRRWAKKQEFSYPDALNLFECAFYGDNGKQYFIKLQKNEKRKCDFLIQTVKIILQPLQLLPCVLSIILF